jgi:hypothetical protein
VMSVPSGTVTFLLLTSRVDLHVAGRRDRDALPLFRHDELVRKTVTGMTLASRADSDARSKP